MTDPTDPDPQRIIEEMAPVPKMDERVLLTTNATVFMPDESGTNGTVIGSVGCECGGITPALGHFDGETLLKCHWCGKIVAIVEPKI